MACMYTGVETSRHCSNNDSLIDISSIHIVYMVAMVDVQQRYLATAAMESSWYRSKKSPDASEISSSALELDIDAFVRCTRALHVTQSHWEKKLDIGEISARLLINVYTKCFLAVLFYIVRVVYIIQYTFWAFIMSLSWRWLHALFHLYILRLTLL